MKRAILCCCALIGLSLLAQAQRHAPAYRTLINEDDSLNRLAPPPPRVYREADLEQVERDAGELAGLAQSIPTGVSQARKGVLPKDLRENLKRIEKLSKRLRSELSL